ncbi:MAG TPA: hypothetical protein VF552_11120 [Allosphingosinicella sp.]|jgi:hypothetical protein
MYRILLAAALAASAAGAHAQAPELGPVVQDVPGRWIWRLRPDSVVPVNIPGIAANAQEFWIVGENRGTSGARFAHARIGLDCRGNRFVRERLVSLDADRNVITDNSVGDHPSNWTAILAGTSIDGARRLLCRVG